MNCGCMEIRIFAKTQAALNAVMTESRDALCNQEWSSSDYSEREWWQVLPPIHGRTFSREQEKWLPNGITGYAAKMVVVERELMLIYFADVVKRVLDAHKDGVFAFIRECSPDGIDPGGHFFKDYFEASTFQPFASYDFNRMYDWIEGKARQSAKGGVS